VSGLTSETVTGRLTFPSDNGASAAPTIVARTHAARMPILVIAIAGGAMLALLLLWLAARRRRRRAEPAVIVPPSASPAEAA
jgi:hypothetical protein